ncbi:MULTISPECIES: RidA family protein [unclassified Geodermatophilus]
MGRFETFGFGVPWEDLANYSQAVRAGDRLYVSGQLSHDADGTFLHEGDVEGQTEVTLANLDAVLSRFGAQRTDIVEMNVFLVGLRANFAPAMAVCKRYFGDHRPASNAFGVVELALPEQLIEIAATAVLAPAAASPA